MVNSPYVEERFRNEALSILKKLQVLEKSNRVLIITGVKKFLVYKVQERVVLKKIGVPASCNLFFHQGFLHVYRTLYSRIPEVFPFA